MLEEEKESKPPTIMPRSGTGKVKIRKYSRGQTMKQANHINGGKNILAPDDNAGTRPEQNVMAEDADLDKLLLYVVTIHFRAPHHKQ